MDSFKSDLILYMIKTRLEFFSTFGVHKDDNYDEWVKLFLFEFVVKHTAKFDFATIFDTFEMVVRTIDPSIPDFYEEDDSGLFPREIDSFYLPYDDLDVDYTKMVHDCRDNDDAGLDVDHLSEFVENISYLPEGQPWADVSDSSFNEHLEDIQDIPSFKDIEVVEDVIPFDDDGEIRDVSWTEATPSLALDVTCDADFRNCGFEVYESGSKHVPKWRPKIVQVKPDPSIIQSAIDELYPHHHCVDDRFFQEWVETHDIDLEVSDCNLDFSVFNDWTKGVDTRLVPNLQVGGLSHRVPTQNEALIAIKKRNMNVPELQNQFDHDTVLNRCVNRFITHIIDKSRLSKLKPISGEEVFFFNQYLENKKPPLSEYKGPVPLLALDRYLHMIKTTLKPVEEDSLHIERPVPATITYHRKGTVMMTTPYFLAAMARLLYVVKSKIYIPTGKFHQIFQMNPDNLKHSKYFKEIDFSKFDKSQGRLHHDIQLKLLLHLGIPQHFIETWFNAHERSHIRDRDCGVGFSVDYQRRTGDACTYLGNTLVTLSVLSYVYDLSSPNILLVAASGDDSLIGSVSPLPRDNEDLCVSLFNLETKFPHNQPFICSKFLLVVECDDGSEEVLAVPNPLKLLQKLGPKNLQVTVLDDYYQSLCDILWVFEDADICRRTAELAEYRHFKGRKNCLFLESALLSLPSLVANKLKFIRRTINLEGSKACIKENVYSDLLIATSSKCVSGSDGLKSRTQRPTVSNNRWSDDAPETRTSGRDRARRIDKRESWQGSSGTNSGRNSTRRKEPARKGRIKLH
nr:MAG: RNA-dependent RNA polymerase [Solanum nigrum ilarvirus 1]WFG33701.1 MAG: RNA-dependent RNA polymerase [Solanum nigrum ilarvirus 1]